MAYYYGLLSLEFLHIEEKKHVLVSNLCDSFLQY